MFLLKLLNCFIITWTIFQITLFGNFMAFHSSLEISIQDPTHYNCVAVWPRYSVI